MYRQNAGLDKPEIGRWLGVSHKVGKIDVLLGTTRIWDCCTTVQRVTHLEKQPEEYKKPMKYFQQGLEGKWQVESANVSDRAIQDKQSRLQSSRLIPSRLM